MGQRAVGALGFRVKDAGGKFKHGKPPRGSRRLTARGVFFIARPVFTHQCPARGSGEGAVRVATTRFSRARVGIAQSGFFVVVRSRAGQRGVRKSEIDEEETKRACPVWENV